MTNITVKQSGIHGLGIFAASNLYPGDIILEWKECMEVLPGPDLSTLSPDERKRVSFIDGQYVLFKPPACWVNHSCDANARGSNGKDMAIRVIKEGEEITVNYLEEKVPGLNFKCNCGSPQCGGFLKSANE